MESVKGNGKMKTAISKSILPPLAVAALSLATCLFAGVPNAYAQKAAQSLFSSADDALQALTSAAKEKDRTALAKVFGPEYDKLLTGDEVEDNKDLGEFASAASEAAQLQKVDDSKFTVTIGHDHWPMPIPLVHKDGKWLFDTKAGLEEALNRKIGENELSAITTCRAYAVAQWEYFTEGDWDQDSVAEYAQKMYGTPGKHDGLYWETAEDVKPSPLGRLVATAQAEGYGAKGNS
jgi:hypothetical protein